MIFLLQSSWVLVCCHTQLWWLFIKMSSHSKELCENMLLFFSIETTCSVLKRHQDNSAWFLASMCSLRSWHLLWQCLWVDGLGRVQLELEVGRLQGWLSEVRTLQCLNVNLRSSVFYWLCLSGQRKKHRQGLPKTSIHDQRAYKVARNYVRWCGRCSESILSIKTSNEIMYLVW